MTGDWSLTLLALSPYLLAATAATRKVLALVRRPARGEQARGMALYAHDEADRIAKASGPR